MPPTPSAERRWTASDLTPAYSLLTVLMLLTLLGIAMGGLLFFITQAARTSGAMIERRRTFYACDGMSRQIMTLSQKFLERNTLEDVPESVMEAELRAALAPNVPAGFSVSGSDLEIPEKALPSPVPVETITNGPFAGLQAKIQTIDIRLQATKNLTGAVCRTEQSISLGRIALFQFFVFADLPLLDVAPPNGESLFLRGRIHTNGRVCLGGAPFSLADGNTPFAVRMDSRVTAVERILHGSSGFCQLSSSLDAPAIVNFRAPGEQGSGPDRLRDSTAFDPLRPNEASGCADGRPGPLCTGGWRSYAVAHWIGRVQDIDHQVSQLTLPVDPPVRHVQLGWAANGGPVLQQMLIGSSRPNTRFLIEPELTNDPSGFARNKMARKAQIRIIDGVWYLKDPGTNNDPNVDGDDGPWPGIPIWSDHPGEYRTGIPSMTREGVEGGGSGAGRAGPGIEVGQSDIRADIADRASSDSRFARADWTHRETMANVPPTPRRFSYYAFVDRAQADVDAARGSAATLEPSGAGLQWGRVCETVVIPSFPSPTTSIRCDTDPPAVLSYGAISPVVLASNGNSLQSYWQPGFRLTNRDFVTKSKNRKSQGDAGWCGGSTTSGVGDEIRNAQTASATLLPVRGVDNSGNVQFSDFPLPGSPLPSLGTTVSFVGGAPPADSLAAVCDNDGDPRLVRRRARLALLEGTRTGFVDTNNQNDSRLRPPAQEKILPVNIDVHALQEALADRTPGELGSYFCTSCVWRSFDGSLFVTNTWRGSMLGAPVFPDGEAAPPPDPSGVVDPNQPRAANETLSTTSPLPYPLCAAPSDEPAAGPAHAQLVNHRFVDADEEAGGGFTFPYSGNFPARPFNHDWPAGVPAPPTSLVPPEATTTLSHPDIQNPSPARVLRGSFAIPNCALYSLTTPGPFAAVRPTAVRVINARVINRNASLCGQNQNQPCVPALSEGTGTSLSAVDRLPDGLNLISNVPVYVVGDVNQTSETNDVQTGVKATDWVPFMIGADTITTLSNSWDDDQSRWRVDTDDTRLSSGFPLTIRPASSTRYHMLLLTGINAAGAFAANGAIATLAQSGGGLPNAMRLMEDWSAAGATHSLRGALVLGWNPVYTQWKVAAVNRRSYLPPPLRDWQFDRHLNTTINQPPNSPVFDVAAVRSWRRE